ncbi:MULTISPECIES: hypothetical protein [unclassified Inquilinus]|uniref:hypothetical protein n=1 Tax=unclassified Inquilinus TaxID=2645927 RepID=UPI003F8F187B
MSSILQGPIARTVASALAGVAYPMTVKHVTGPPVYDPESGEVITPTIVLPCRGWMDDFSVFERALGSSSILATDRKVVILCETISAAPAVSDQVNIGDGVWRRIAAVEQDPAAATWTCQAQL